MEKTHELSQELNLNMCVKYNKIDSTSQLNNIFFVTQQMIQEKSLNVLVGGSLDSQALLVPLPSTLTCIMARFRIQIVAKKIMPARYCTTLIFNFSSIRQQTVTILEDWLVGGLTNQSLVSISPPPIKG